MNNTILKSTLHISLFLCFFSISTIQAQQLKGAWKLENKSSGTTKVKIYSENYFMTGEFATDNKTFKGATGGTYSADKNKLKETFEYNTYDSTKVGKENNYTIQLKGDRLSVTSAASGKKVEEIWDKMKEPVSSTLAGAWRITEREVDGKMSGMQRGPRKTIKILSNGRFQWAAFNTATKQFMGTGGGTYEIKDGKYTEVIEFFSRDNSRSGMSLTFDYDVKDNRWHHQGLSSTGNKVNEIWDKE